jgi:hypothetical protein
VVRELPGIINKGNLLGERSCTMQKLITVALVIAALASGLTIALIDTSPGWNDTGITAMGLLGICAIFGAIKPNWAWVWALIIGLWLPGLNILIYHNYGSFLALAFAFAGAFLGAFTRKLITNTNRVV